jgi:hypothetical protein
MDNKKVLLVLALAVVLVGTTGCVGKNDDTIGGQKDEHGCLVAAGYTWCGTSEKCVRVFEEFCPDTAMSMVSEIEKEAGIKMTKTENSIFNWLFADVDRLAQAEIVGIGFSAKDLNQAQFQPVDRIVGEKMKADELNVADGVGSEVRGYIDGYMACLFEKTLKSGTMDAGMWDVDLKCGYFNPNSGKMNILNK